MQGGLDGGVSASFTEKKGQSKKWNMLVNSNHIRNKSEGRIMNSLHTQGTDSKQQLNNSQNIHHEPYRATPSSISKEAANQLVQLPQTIEKYAVKSR